MKTEILLGFEVGSAEPVYIPLHHLAIFGITQLSGKTTTLEALISRSGRRAVAFITKRGECGFRNYNLVEPYYKPRSDWQFIEGLVNVALGEKVKYEPGMRYGIIRVCQGCRSIQEVRNAALRLSRETRREFMRAVYEKLVAYLDIVIPELDKWKFSDKLELSEGINVMDISEMRMETQHLVIASTIEYVFSNLSNVIVVIPEAWESLPQGKMTPVKWVAQQFVRKGAAVGNYLWIDSQDIGGTDKTPLRQCDNWLMGRVKEAHEVGRVLKQLLGKKIEAEEIQTLPLGHFYAVIGNEVKKVYVLPAGVPEEVGVEVAKGIKTPESVRDEFLKPKIIEEDEMWKEKYLELERQHVKLKEELEILKKSYKEEFEQRVERERQKVKELETELANVKFLSQRDSEQVQQLLSEKNELLERIDKLEKELSQYKTEHEALENLRKLLVSTAPLGFEPSQIDLEHKGLVVKVRHAGDKVVKVSTDNVVGQILFAAVTYFKDREFATGELNERLLEHGWNIKASTLSAKLSLLVNEGKLVKTDKGYRLPSMVRFEVKGEVES